MEIRLRQRLVGAVVIIALAIIFIPMFFKSANLTAPSKMAADTKTSTADTNAQIILTDQGGSTATPANTQPAQSPVSTAKQSQAIAANQAAVLGTTNPNKLAFGNESLPIPAATSDTTSDEEAPPPAPKTMAKPVKSAKPNVVAATAPKAKPQTSTAKASTSAQQLTFAQQAVQAEIDIVTATTDDAAPAATAWVVQLGSFSSNVNAQKLVTELHAKGFAAFTRVVKTSGNSIVKVFVGPEVRRNKADALQTNLAQNMHVKGVVVSFDPLQVK